MSSAAFHPRAWEGHDDGDRPMKRVKNADSPLPTELPPSLKKVQATDNIVPNFEEQDTTIMGEREKVEVQDSLLEKKASLWLPEVTTYFRASPGPSHALPSNKLPSIAWKTEDDEQLITARKEGMNWGPIAVTYFPSKTPNSCRKRHERLMEKKKQEGWDGVRLEELATVYLECRREIWQFLATRMSEKLDTNEDWQILENKCMEKGLKTLLSVGSNRGPSGSSTGHNFDHDGWNDSGLGSDISHASSGPSSYHSTSNLHVYSSSYSSSALPYNIPLPDPRRTSGNGKKIEYQLRTQMLQQLPPQPSSQTHQQSLLSIHEALAIIRSLPSLEPHVGLTCDDDKAHQKHEHLKEEKANIEDEIRLTTAPEGRTSMVVNMKPIEDGKDQFEGVGTFASADAKKRRGRNATPGRCHSYYAKLCRKMGSKSFLGSSDLQPREIYKPTTTLIQSSHCAGDRMELSAEQGPMMFVPTKTETTSCNIPSILSKSATSSEINSPPMLDHPALESSRHGSTSTDDTDMSMSGPEIDYLTNEAADIPIDDEKLPDCELEQRLLNPRAYFQKLEILERTIYENSAVQFYKPGLAGMSDRCPFQLRIPFKGGQLPHSDISDDTIMGLCNQARFNGLFQLLECRNLIFRVSDNLRMLQEAGFCTTRFSVVVQDQYRRKVARLVPIDIIRVHELCETFESSLGNVVKLDDSNLSRYQGMKDLFSENTQLITTCCIDFLVSLGLMGTADTSPTSFWRRAIQVLDLAVVAYAGAHIEPIDESYLGVQLESFAIPGPFAESAGSQEILQDAAQDVIIVRRRKLQRLDQFLGEKEVWVFHLDSACTTNESMLLSTDAEILADMWGPMWRSTRASDPEHIYEYSIGNGSIMPWPRNDAIDPLPMRTPSNSQEVFCHWVSSRDWDSDELKSHQAGLTKRHFDGSETLFIGAEVPNGLRVNDQCVPSIARLAQLKKRFREVGALQTPRTHKSRRYKDSHAVQVQGSAMGFVSIAGTVTYKRREGHTMKDALVERWRNGARNIVELEAFSGIEVSLCTRNARRRRLLHLLGSQSMRKYLKSISFEWKDDACETGYFKALRSPRAFRTFWKQHSDWRRNIGDAVSECLEALQDTGIHQQNKELSALWVETFDEEGDSDGESLSDLDQSSQLATTTRGGSGFEAAEEWIVTLFRSEHTWTGFLKDSPECLTMAVMDSACLDLDGIAGQVAGYGRRCQSHRVRHRDGSIDRWAAGYPVLQTAIELNEEMLKDEGLHCEKSKDKSHKRYLDISSLEKDYRFVLGDQGYLIVYTRPSPEAPLILEWEPVDSETWEELKNVNMKEIMLGTNATKHHREYIRGTWECSPLPILLVSNSNKPRFCKKGLSLSRDGH